MSTLRTADIAANWPATRISVLLRECGVWPDVSESAVASLRASGRFVSFEEGRQIAFRNEKSERLYIVLTGAIRLCMRSSDDREFVISLIEPGNYFSLVDCLDSKPTHYDAYAQVATTALAVEAAVLRRLLNEESGVREAVVQALCNRLRQAFDGIEQFAIWTPRARLAACLLGLARSHGRPHADGIEIKTHLQQESLAAMISVSRPHTNKMLRNLEQAGILHLEYGRIVVRDLARLRGELRHRDD